LLLLLLYFLLYLLLHFLLHLLLYLPLLLHLLLHPGGVPALPASSLGAGEETQPPLFLLLFLL
jgi:hypothetical protein